MLQIEEIWNMMKDFLDFHNLWKTRVIHWTFTAKFCL